jgi:CheY-like chemotaxis protein
VEVVRPSAAAKDIKIHFKPPSHNCELVADPDRIQQVAWNLLSNAVKFTGPGGSVHLEIRRTDSQLVLSVADTGQGIEPSFLPFVFERFRQADGSPSRRAGGLGLGLALARHIVELHGGSVQALSEGSGKGATFNVALPIRRLVPTMSPPETPARAKIKTQRQSVTLRGVRVLVVDDEPDARELLKTVLAEANAQVETAGSVAEALDTVTRFQPHVLVSDVGMPGEDGYAFIRRLRDQGAARGGDIPAIALTAYTHSEDRTRALAAGFTSHLAKPVRPEDLLSVVADLALCAPK